MQKRLIYVVEDEENIRELLQVNLEDSGYRVKGFGSGEDFLAQCKNALPDLVLLDIMLPGINGLEVCRKMRFEQKMRKIPVLMLTAKSEEIDKVLGLEMGAEDYITKPFSIRELLARIKVAFRRGEESYAEAEAPVTFGAVRIDFVRREVHKDEQVVELTYKEFELLKLLLQNKRKVLTREQILESVWGMDYLGETRTVDVHIRYLRQKLERNDKVPEYIETVRGLGYRFNDKKAGEAR